MAKKTTNANKVSKSLSDELAVLLSDTFVLALKTQNYHWNIRGPNFYALHKMFEEQYDALYEASDLLAERIRALGSVAPGGLADFSKITNILDAKKNASSSEMLSDLAKSHESIVKLANSVIKVAEKLGDQATVDIIVTRIEDHDKVIWMLKSSL